METLFIIGMIVLAVVLAPVANYYGEKFRDWAFKLKQKGESK